MRSKQTVARDTTVTPYRHTWRDLSRDYATVGSPSTTRKCNPRLLFRPEHESSSPDQYSSSGSQSSGSIQFGIVGCPWYTIDLADSNKSDQREGRPGPLMNKRRGLSSRNGVLFHKQLIRTAIRLSVPNLEVASCTQVRKLQVVQSKSLRIATNETWYVSNKQIHKYLEVQFLSAHHHSINLRFRLKLVSKTTELGTRQALARTVGSPGSPDESDQKSAPIQRLPSRHNVFGWSDTEFPWFSLSFKA
jgi:hypothetical protein